MPSIRIISDLRNNSKLISEYCRKTNGYKNGAGDMVE